MLVCNRNSETNVVNVRNIFLGSDTLLFHTILCVCVFFSSYKCHVLVIQFLFLNPDFFVVFVFSLMVSLFKKQDPHNRGTLVCQLA